MFPYTEVDEVVVLKPFGELNIENAHLFKNWVFDTFIEKGKTKILLDLSEVESIDSFSLGVIVNILKSVSTRSGSFAIVSPNEQVMKILRITSLDRVIKVYDTVSEALAEVKKS